MINITSKEPTENYIRGVDAEFDVMIKARMFNNLSLEVMKKVDNAELLDKNLGTIKTPYGITDITHLSTGCKTVLLYLNMPDEDKNCILNISQAGPNALEVLFDCVDLLKDSNSKFYLGYAGGLRHMKKHTFSINGIVCNDLFRGLLYVKK